MQRRHPRGRRHGGAGGSIVNISSDCARRGGPTRRMNGVGGLVLYAAAKSAVDGFRLDVAVEVAGESIRVNVIRPATVVTPAHDVDGADHYANMANRTAESPTCKPPTRAP